jgi:hypothetical protein
LELQPTRDTEVFIFCRVLGFYYALELAIVPGFR